jgi:hypothetical protein
MIKRYRNVDRQHKTSSEHRAEVTAVIREFELAIV